MRADHKPSDPDGNDPIGEWSTPKRREKDVRHAECESEPRAI